ncbi:hypothetical protein [Xanthomonas phage SB4]|uniref:Uncharacterized protein n=1 Tax=Xanthomonas phage SB4 TaxID=3117473 RepID=A0ABZ2GY37_9CAUD
MATINAKLPFVPGSTVKLKVAVDVFPVGTQAYVCFYQFVKDELLVQVRVPDDVLGTFDLFIPVASVEALV